MKKHISSLFNIEHNWKTIFYLFASVLLIITSHIVGIDDNILGIAMLFGGITWLFLALLHPFRKWKILVILAGVLFKLILLPSVGIIILAYMHKTEYINEALIINFILFFYIPGMVVGIIRSFLLFDREKNCIHYTLLKSNG